jgi:hypothetical protein
MQIGSERMAVLDSPARRGGLQAVAEACARRRKIRAWFPIRAGAKRSKHPNRVVSRPRTCTPRAGRLWLPPMRRLAHAAVVLLVSGAPACGEPEDVERGDPFAGPADPTRAEGLSAAATESHAGDDESEGSASSDDASEGSGSDAGTGSMGTFSPLDDGESDGNAAPQPVDGWWSPCLSAKHCDPGLACLGTDDMSDGVCTAQCVPYGDPESCAPSPGGSAETTCLTVGGGSVCALDCSNGRSCPAGMKCLSDHDDLGPISICL